MKPAEAKISLVSGDPLVVLDATDLRIVAWNDAAEQLTGFRRQDVVDRPCWQALGGIDETGGTICCAACAIANDALEGRQVPSVHVIIETRYGRRRVALSTISVQVADRQLIAHVLQPIRLSGSLEPAHQEERPAAGAERTPALTRRQVEVLRLLQQGVSTREIAASLSVAETTVRNHITGILQQLGAHSRLEAVAKARRFNLI